MVLFDGDNKAYIGVEHGKRPSISTQDMNRIQTITKKHGAWFEGNGGDVKTVGMGASEFKGSWDDKLQQKISGYPPEFLYTIFTNTEENKQAETLTKPGATIFDSIVKAQDKVSYLKGRRFTPDVLQNFLRMASENDVDLAKMAQKEATPENVRQFLKAGEDLMWPDNWERYPNKAGKLAKKVNDQRQDFLSNQQTGVYVVGSDHLKELKSKMKLRNISGMRPRQAQRPLMAGINTFNGD
jgi:hypothetical protein